MARARGPSTSVHARPLWSPSQRDARAARARGGERCVRAGGGRPPGARSWSASRRQRARAPACTRAVFHEHTVLVPASCAATACSPKIELVRSQYRTVQRMPAGARRTASAGRGGGARTLRGTHCASRNEQPAHFTLNSREFADPPPPSAPPAPPAPPCSSPAPSSRHARTVSTAWMVAHNGCAQWRRARRAVSGRGAARRGERGTG
jgi:hypothetical protein